MTTPRRRILRPPAPNVEATARRARQMNRLRTRLHAERTALDRWTRRLKRAFHAFERQTARVARIEKQINGHAE